MSDGDPTRRARWARARTSRHEASEQSSPPHGPLVRRGAPPPLLFQVDTLDPWHDSHPGQSLHSGARHEIDAAFERALGPSPEPAPMSAVDVAETPLADLFDPVTETLLIQPPVAEPPVPEASIADEPTLEVRVVDAPAQAPAEEPAVAASHLFESETVKPETVEPETVEPETAEPEAAEPEADEPLVVEPPAALFEAPDEAAAESVPAEPAQSPETAPPVPAIDPTVVELPHTTPETSATETTIVLPPLEGIVPAPAIYVPPAPALEPPAAQVAPTLDAPLDVQTPDAPAAEPFVLEPPTYVPPAPAAPLVLEPPLWQPPGREAVSIESPDEDEVAAPSEQVPTFWAPPGGQAEPPAQVPTFWSPPVAGSSAPPVDQPYLQGPPLSPVEPTPRFFTRDGVPSAPVSLAKDVDAWTAALQPEAPSFTAEAFATGVTEAPEVEAPSESPAPSWFDGHLDPFSFASQFGTPSEQFADPATAGVDGSEDDPNLIGGRHRIEAEQPPARQRKAKKERKPARKAPWWELPALVALAIVIAVVVKSFVVQPFYIPSPSMEKTLHGCSGCSGDRILVNKPIYDLRDPHPGDIVVFNAPPGWNEEQGTKPPSNPILRAGRGFLQLVGFVPPDGLVLVKRVIAVGGQTVKGVSTDGGTTEQIMVSDHGDAGPWKTLKEPYVFMDAPDINANFGPVLVPKGRLWVMGDHRNDSADSRYHCGTPTGTAGSGACDNKTSTVPVDDVIGKAFVIAWPPSRWRTLGTPSTFGAGLVLPLFFFRRRRRRQA